ncbi:MAG: 3-deoxy-8-phosphooctulonate synthase [Chitinophagaceae bacterium]|jgi:2-dehydro-3-deoxyphosphooctonate aldolase (KDO 8-P synthase)|nr:3-deoxy-8-phosphooctulonate synthase [Chitinophagaceae bacterium]
MENYLQQLFSDQQYDMNNFFLIAGPCIVESREVVEEVAKTVSAICKRNNVPYILKASYKKANRTSASSFTGIGDKTALEIIKNTGKKFSFPTTTDFHTAEEASMAAEYVDILQIPAFLCRQTDLLVAAGKTGKIINVKKGQFLSGDAMRFAVEKIKNSGNEKVMLTERGNTFGYKDLVVDYRNIPAMKKNNVPVIMDCTHSLQQPNQTGGVTGGNPEMIETIAKAAIAAGADGLFIETHPNPAQAKSDGANMLNLALLETLIEKLVRLKKALN